MASSANGKIVWAAMTNGPVFYSTNSGASWGSKNWNNPYYTTGLAASPNADVLVAVTGKLTPGKIYVSTDSGATWPATSAPLLYWSSVACSADGHKIVAAATDGSVYISQDTGQIWAPSTTPVKYWTSAAMSADGTQLILASTNGTLCVSVDGGNTWATNGSSGTTLLKSRVTSTGAQIENSSAPVNGWQAVACSADKSQLVAAEKTGSIYLSQDAGVSWTVSSAPVTAWKAVACSADASVMVAAPTNGPIYTSVDAGATWVSNSVPVSSWVSIAVSADGSRMVAAAAPAYGHPQSQLYTSYFMRQPRLNLVRSAGDTNVELMWILPGTNFVVQQSAALGSADWSSLTNEPSLNLSNLQYQLTLVQSNDCRFFRLATP